MAARMVAIDDNTLRRPGAPRVEINPASIRRSILDGLRKPQVDQARLDDGPQVLQVDLEDAVHPGEADQDAALARDGATGESGSGPTRRVRYAARVAELDDRGDVPGARR